MALLYNTIATPSPAVLTGDTTVVFDVSASPVLAGAELGVIVTRNGVVQATASVTVVAAATVTLTLDALMPVEDWEAAAGTSFECRYPVGYEATPGAGLTFTDVLTWVSLPLMDPTNAQAARALAAAQAWARERVSETDLDTDPLALWEMAVLNFSWSLLTRGSQPVLSVKAGDVDTHWGAVGGLNPSEEFQQTAEQLLYSVGTWAGPSGHPAATDALADAVEDYADEIPISLKKW